MSSCSFWFRRSQMIERDKWLKEIRDIEIERDNGYWEREISFTCSFLLWHWFSVRIFVLFLLVLSTNDNFNWTWSLSLSFSGWFSSFCCLALLLVPPILIHTIWTHTAMFQQRKGSQFPGRCMLFFTWFIVLQCPCASTRDAIRFTYRNVQCNCDGWRQGAACLEGGFYF